MAATARNLTGAASPHAAREAVESARTWARWRPQGGAGERGSDTSRSVAGFLATLLISPAVLVIAALVGAPLVLAAYLSFTDAQAGSLTGQWVGLENFRRALHDPIFRGALWHTFIFTVISQAVVDRLRRAARPRARPQLPRPLAAALPRPAAVGRADRADRDRVPLVLRPAGSRSSTGS